MEKEELIGQQWKVLDDGFIRCVDLMGDDSSVVQAARISTGKGTKTPEEDRNLIRYLMRHRHTTPFEMCELKLHVRAPIYVFRQWHRHRMASLNEYSGRYSEMINSCETTPSDQWRLQSTINKQGSNIGEINWPEDRVYGNSYKDKPGEYLSRKEKELLEQCREIYEDRLKFGVAKEQARKDLPVSNYSEMYWKIDLHNLLHFLSLRMDSHAQKEIRDYATIIGEEIVARWVPESWSAFKDYRLDSFQLSREEIETLKDILYNFNYRMEINSNWEQIPKLKNKREQEEFQEKIKKLGIYYDN